MIDYSTCIYSPAIRTRRAELVGLSHVADPFSAGLLPVFEFTRSRRTKSNPEGSVEVSLADVLDIVKDNYFVADLTTLASLTNSEVERLLDPQNDFASWRDFVSSKLPATALPVVHLTDPFDAQSLLVQTNAFLARNNRFAVRIPSDFRELDLLVETFQAHLGDLSAAAVFADVGLVTQRGLEGAKARVKEIGVAISDLGPGLFAPLASSFPSTVTPFGDQRGLFTLHEVHISDYMKDDFAELNCIHGDYACIHPQDLEGMAINWVPRVDVPLDDRLFYHRYRRHDGGYVRAAAEALKDGDYVPLRCWGDRNIRDAAAGDPSGKAPAFWISVRLNYHIERQMMRLGA